MLSVDVTSKALIAECGIPDADVPRVRLALKQASVSDTNYIIYLGLRYMLAN
jgi:hypothetical protein